MVTRRRCQLLSLALVVSAGCDRIFGPERMETATITGRVHADGRSIGKRWIEFMPREGTRGRLRSAPLRPDGTFLATRVPVGVVGVSLPGSPSPSTGNPALDGALEKVRHQPFMRLNVRDGQNPPLEIDLDRRLREDARRMGK
jgi:hypothetical protein